MVLHLNRRSYSPWAASASLTLEGVQRVNTQTFSLAFCSLSRGRSGKEVFSRNKEIRMFPTGCGADAGLLLLLSAARTSAYFEPSSVSQLQMLRFLNDLLGAPENPAKGSRQDGVFQTSHFAPRWHLINGVARFQYPQSEESDLGRRYFPWPWGEACKLGPHPVVNSQADAQEDSLAYLDFTETGSIVVWLLKNWATRRARGARRFVRTICLRFRRVSMSLGANSSLEEEWIQATVWSPAQP